MEQRKENALDLFYKKTSILISGGNGVRKAMLIAIKYFILS